VLCVDEYFCYELHTPFYSKFSFRRTPYADEIIGNRQYGFGRNRSTTDQMSSIRQILEKKMGEQWDSTTDIYGLREVP